MSVIALCSAHGAPGVTTAALAMTHVWPSTVADRRVLLVDADPAGSTLVPGRFLGAIPDGAGVAGLVTGRSNVAPEDVIAHSVALDDDASRMLLPGVIEPSSARPLMSSWNGILDACRDLSDRGIDVIVDVGRVGHRYEPSVWLTESDLVGVVMRRDLASVTSGATAMRALRAGRATPVLTLGIVVDTGPYVLAEISTALPGTAVAPVAHDPRSAEALGTGQAISSRMERSPLLRSSRSVVDLASQMVPQRTEVTR